MRMVIDLYSYIILFLERYSSKFAIPYSYTLYLGSELIP